MFIIIITEVKDVETMLQLMFEGEINPTDEGIEQLEEPVKYTLNTFTL